MSGLGLIPGQRTTPEYLKHLKEAVNADANPVISLGIDPGESNGICGYDIRNYLVFMLTIQSDDITMFLQQFEKVKNCIMEDYRVYPGKEKAHVYSNLKTTRVIGQVKTWAETHNVELIMQPASIKNTGYAWIGEKPLPKSNKMNHQLDAHVHFMYWAVKTGRINAADLMKRSKI